MNNKNSGLGMILYAVMAFSTAPFAANAAAIVNVWNGAASPDGSYLNAGNIANTLAFTNVSVSATSEIRYLETVNLATSAFGPTFFNLGNTAPKTSISGDVTMGAGNFSVSSALIDLSGSFYSSSSVLLSSATRVGGNATSVNVLSNAASLQQALFLTQGSAGLSTITAAFGNASSLAFNYDTKMILSGGLLSGSVALTNLSALLELHGYAFELDTGSGFQPFGSGSVTAVSGQLRGYLDSGDSLLFSFNQGTAGQIVTFDSAPLSPVPLPPAVWLLGSAVMTLIELGRRRKKT